MVASKWLIRSCLTFSKFFQASFHTFVVLSSCFTWVMFLKCLHFLFLSHTRYHAHPKIFKLLLLVCYHLSFLTLIWHVATCNSRITFKELSPHSSFCALSCALLMWRFTFSLNDHIGFPISQALLTLSKHTQYHRRESLFTSRVNYYQVRYNLLYLFIKTETWCVKL